MPTEPECDKRTRPSTAHAGTCAPFFLMAHHRSGSNFLNDVLQQHRGIECLNEPLSMHTQFFRDHDLKLWHAEDFDPGTLHPSLAAEPAVRDYLLDMRQYLMQSRPGRLFGFKDTCLFGKLGWFRAFMPSLKIVFLRRDPRAIVSSVLRSKLAGFWFYADVVPPIFASLFPHYTSRALPGEVAVRAAETAAMSVAARYELARRTLGLFNHLSLELDDLMHDPLRPIHTLADFLGVEPDPDQIAFITARQQESRGGLFSSFRSVEDVEDTWRGHLTARQLEVVEDVMRVLQQPPRNGSSAQAGRA